MSDWAVAKFWDSPEANEMAREISSISGLYCGPAAVGWIAAVWNERKGRRYDYMSRLKDKSLFPDGPIPFRLRLPGINLSLSKLMQRETNHELQLSNETYYRYNTIHDSLRQFEMPVIIRTVAPKLRDGLHYVTLYKSERSLSNNGAKIIKLYQQDNGLTVNHNQTDAYRTGWTSGFVSGAKRVVEVQVRP